MKTLKIPLIAIVLIFCIGLAVTPTIVNAFTLNPPPVEYYWFQTNDAGTDLSDPTGIDEEDAPSEAGPCNGSSPNVCAKGLTESQTTVSGGRRVPLTSVNLSTITIQVQKN